MTPVERVRTGITGLDDLIEGGLPRGYCYTLVGGPGVGKTIFSVQFLYNGATKYGENGIYLTFDEPPDSIKTNAKRFGIDLEELEKAGKLVIIDAHPIRMGLGKYAIRAPLVFGTPDFNIGSVLSLLNKARKKIGAKRIVVDSLTSLMMQYKDPFTVRREVLTLMKTLSESDGCTSILLSESPEEREGTSRYEVETFLAQGVIILHNMLMKDTRIRAIEIRKMRGTKHSGRMYPFRITDRGIEVLPEERLYGEVKF